ncbi:MAG: thioredoxin-like domain-containing protein [Kiritimatiellales bacterium]
MKKHWCVLCLIFCLTGLALAGNMTEAAGQVFINSAGEKKEAALSGKIVAFYFSSLKFHAFTPRLIEFYSGCKQTGADFEVIFVSNDASETEMMQCMKDADMPWPAAPYDSAAAKALKQIKKNELKVKGLPGALVIVRDGQVLTETGKQDILDAGSDAYKKWQALAAKTAEEPAVAKKEKGSGEPKSAVAAKLPPPEKESCLAGGFESNQAGAAGKIIKIKFNRISYIQKLNKGLMYTGNLGSSEKSDGHIYYNHPGIQVRFPQEGVGFFSKFIPQSGSAQDDVSYLIKPDLGEVYVQVSRNAETSSMAVGDRYNQDSDGGKYEWSVETEVPDLTAKDKVSVDDVLLFPNQLNGKTVVLEFYDAAKTPKKPAGESPAYISCGGGHARVEIAFPPEGKAFFKGIADQNHFPKANTVYAVVNVSGTGVITLEAKGRRASGSGDDVTYKW